MPAPHRTIVYSATASTTAPAVTADRRTRILVMAEVCVRGPARHIAPDAATGTPTRPHASYQRRWWGATAPR